MDSLSSDALPGDSARGITPQNVNATPSWNYPTRMCRICHEDVVPTVSLYPPGLPVALQRPVVEYKNDDEYGRLIKPCRCRGGMRYIHELCLRRSRTEGARPGSLWKCHECGHQFNFKRLTIQSLLESKVISGFLTMIVMITIMFFLGFVADPIINLYVDPYDTLTGREHIWSETDVNDITGSVSAWTQHFLKGMVSMGLVGFLKTALLNPLNWWNLRNTGWISGRSAGRTATGRDRAVNVSWIAITIGVMSAFYFFYQSVQAIIGRFLQRIGNNIVDTNLPGDDDDLKPPAGVKPSPTTPVEHNERFDATPSSTQSFAKKTVNTETHPVAGAPGLASPSQQGSKASTANNGHGDENGRIVDALINDKKSPEMEQSSDPFPDRLQGPEMAFSSGIDNARQQGWSFEGF